jgi:ribosomal protein S18 acetylase RimI-like enzyme
MNIERLTPAHADAYRALMLDAHARCPDAFTSSVDERAALPLAWWEKRLAEDPQAPEFVLGAFAAGRLAGVAGLAFATRAKLRHKARLFGMVVEPGSQRRGLGRALVDAAIAAACSRGGVRVLQLTVTQGNVAAEALYARCGFRSFGVEPLAVAAGDGFLAKVHLWRSAGQDVGDA